MPPHPDRHGLFGWMEGLADPTRLRLLHVLERNELGVAELCQVLQQPQSTVSRHLKILSSQGWVEVRRQGPEPHLPDVRRGSTPPPGGSGGSPAARASAGPRSSRTSSGSTGGCGSGAAAAEDFFAGAAGDWDRLRAEWYGTGFGVSALLALLPPDWTVADLGCGTGALAAALAPEVARVVGVDRSADMLRSARAPHRRARATCELRRGTLEDLPLDDASCDAALLVLSLGWVADPAAGARRGRPGGPPRGPRSPSSTPCCTTTRTSAAAPARSGPASSRPAWWRCSPPPASTDATCRPLPPEPAATGPALLLARARRP